MSAALRVLICDDEPPARSILRRLLAREPGIEVVGECGDGRAAVARLQQGDVDLVFLDVRMPGMSGFDVLRTLPVEATPAVVFVTAYDRYSLAAFDAEAVDYLLKPFDDARFARALGRARRSLAARFAERTEADRRAAARAAGRLVLRGVDRTVFVAPAEIHWVEAADDRVRVHTESGVFDVRDSLTAYARRLGPAFLRVHRSALVRLDAVLAIEAVAGGHQLLLRTGTRVPLGRGQRRAVEARLARE
ncbi:MAG: LytTR family DNA-binding domain-containing protein [Planctomycetota bacterium]